MDKEFVKDYTFGEAEASTRDVLIEKINKFFLVQIKHENLHGFWYSTNYGSQYWVRKGTNNDMKKKGIYVQKYLKHGFYVLATYPDNPDSVEIIVKSDAFIVK